MSIEGRVCDYDKFLRALPLEFITDFIFHHTLVVFHRTALLTMYIYIIIYTATDEVSDL